MLNHSNILYFDYAATTPCAPEVAEAIYISLSDGAHFANASSAHGLAYPAENAIEKSRALVGKLIKGDPSNIIFTSGATEANNLALIGLSGYLKNTNKTHIVSSSAEHKAVLETIEYLASLGHPVTLVDPDESGIIPVSDIEDALTTDTGLVSIMHVNNETGVIQDIAAIGKLAKEYEAIFHVDAAQSAGKLPIDVQTMDIKLLSISAHKFYGPKGIGALYIDPLLLQNISPLLHGGGQEKGIRPGTYANHQIIGLGKAVELALDMMEFDLTHAKKIREVILTELGNTVATINGNRTNRLPSILNISFKDVDATTLITGLHERVALATGSACNSGTLSASHVLVAMGLTGDLLDNAVRISFGRYTTKSQAKEACQIIRSELRRIKSYF